MMISVKKSHDKRISVIIITVLISFCALSLAMTKIIYDGIYARYDEPADIPQQLYTTVQERRVCRFPSGDNLLTGYYYGTSVSNPVDGLVVLVPGFHAGGDDYLWQIHDLLEYGWNVFTFDATGTLQSQGDSQVGFVQSSLDLEAALAYLRENGWFGHDKLALLGHSQGAYAACCALAQEQDVSAVVSVSGVNSAMEAVMQMSVQAIGPVSYGNYGFLWLYQASLFGADATNASAAQTISDSPVPVLVIHGTQDEKIPMDSSSIISHKSQIHSEQVEYYLCDAGHTDILYDADGTANDALIDRIHEFLLRSLRE